MGIGDLVCWKTYSKLSQAVHYKDVGIVLRIEPNTSPYAHSRIIIEVFFMKIGSIWCIPEYLTVLNSYPS